MSQPPQLINGGNFADERGVVSFVNDFKLDKIMRFYTVEHLDTDVRAWQGHRHEQKWFYAIAGSFKIMTIKPDDWQAPSEKLPLNEFILNASVSQVLHISGGYINGFKA